MPDTNFSGYSNSQNYNLFNNQRPNNWAMPNNNNSYREQGYTNHFNESAFLRGRLVTSIEEAKAQPIEGYSW